MYFHPLQEDIANMSDEDISKRIKDLARNPDMLAQLQKALFTYQDAIRQRRIEKWHKDFKKARGEPDLGDLINID